MLHALQDRTRAPRRRGFTLIELVSVIVLVGILSATAIPALGRLDRARDAALLNECDRLIRFAQSHANSTGSPTAARFDLDEQAVSVLAATPDRVRVTPVLRSGTGQPITLPIISAFPGASITAAGLLTNPRSSGTIDLWFDFDGAPQQRSLSAEDPEELDAEFIIRVSSGDELRVQPSTGAIQR